MGKGRLWRRGLEAGFWRWGLEAGQSCQAGTEEARGPTSGTAKGGASAMLRCSDGCMGCAMDSRPVAALSLGER